MPRFSPALLILGHLLRSIAMLMLAPMVLAWWDGVEYQGFLISAVVCGLFGVILKFSIGKKLPQIRQRELFLMTVISWAGLPVFVALPFYLGGLNLSVTDAMFESVSGITTTGATILVGLDSMPRSLLLWRSIIQWLGGIGIIAMAVSILPVLRIGGMRLFQTESSDWSEKAIPRTQVLAAALLKTYFLLTTLCGFSYWIAGMPAFDAINHAMTTVSTAGFSTHDASIGHFNSPLIQWVGIAFMVLGALPFVLYIRYFNQFNASVFRDVQVKGFFVFLAVASVVMTSNLYATHDYPFFQSLTLAVFNVTSILTTTGYSSADYGQWSTMAVVFFFFLIFVGGCSGSTSGGMKIFRFQLSFLVAREQVHKLVHPKVVTSRIYAGQVVDDAIVASTITFTFMFFVTLAVIALCMAMLGLDVVTSLSGAASAVANVGPALGPIIGPAGNFSSLPDAAKWVLCVGMLLGRLELMSVLVLLSRSFWRG